MIKTEIEAKKNQYPCGGRLGYSAIGMHCFVNPVAIAEIPDESGGISQDTAL
jgi:hypothetical protein